MNDAQLR